ncbi:MAG: hypothetical protein ACUVTL_09725 [Thermoproteota archaeon]
MLDCVKACQVPLFQVEGASVPKVVLGHNPFIGYSYLSDARAGEYREKFQRRDIIRDLVIKSVENGVPATFISCEPLHSPLPTANLIMAIEEASRETGVDIFVISNMTDPKNDIERIANLNLRIGVIHGGIIDRMQVENSFEGLEDMLNVIRDAGVIPGVVMHRCDNVEPLLKERLNISLYVSPFDLLGWEMTPSRDSFIKLLDHLPKPYFAIKPLAMGRINPKEGFEWVFKHEKVCGCAIGISSEYEMREDYDLLKTILRKGT